MLQDGLVHLRASCILTKAPSRRGSCLPAIHTLGLPPSRSLYCFVGTALPCMVVQQGAVPSLLRRTEHTKRLCWPALLSARLVGQ